MSKGIRITYQYFWLKNENAIPGAMHREGLSVGEEILPELLFWLPSYHTCGGGVVFGRWLLFSIELTDEGLLKTNTGH